MSVKRQEAPLVALFSIGWRSDGWQLPRNRSAFRWHLVKEGPAKQQIRELWISEAAAAVLLIGSGEAVERAMDLLHLLRETGPPILVAVAQLSDTRTERLLRQTGAIYLCAPEAQARLVDILREMLCKPGVVRCTRSSSPSI